MAIISTETKLARLLQGMIQDLASTCLISGRRAGTLADDGGVVLIKAEQVAVCHKFTSAPAALLFPQNCFYPMLRKLRNMADILKNSNSKKKKKDMRVSSNLTANWFMSHQHPSCGELNYMLTLPLKPAKEA